MSQDEGRAEDEEAEFEKGDEQIGESWEDRDTSQIAAAETMKIVLPPEIPKKSGKKHYKRIYKDDKVSQITEQGLNRIMTQHEEVLLFDYNGLEELADMGDALNKKFEAVSMSVGGKEREAETTQNRKITRNMAKI